MLSHAVMIGYADLPMGIFLTFSGVYAYRYACDGKHDDILLALFFTLCLPLIKRAGRMPYFFFGLYVLFAALTYRQWRVKPKAIWIVTGALVVLTGVDVAVMAVYGDSALSFLLGGIWHRIRPGNRWAEIKAPLLWHFGGLNNWLLIGTLCPFVLVPLTVVFSKRKEFVIGLFALFLILSSIYVFCVGAGYRFLVTGATVNRTYLQIVPTMLYACVVMIAQLPRVVNGKTAGLRD